MSSKKKNAITMIALVVVLIICLVLYFENHKIREYPNKPKKFSRESFDEYHGN